MDTGVVGEFGVESCSHGSSLPHGDRIGAFGGNHFNAFADVFDLGGTDEDHLQGRVAELVLDQSAFADRAVDLASVSVAPDADIEGAEAFLFWIVHFPGEQDRAGTGAKSGLGLDELLELFESGVAQEFQERSRFASGDDEAVDLVELLRLFDEQNFGAQLFEPAAVGVEIALEGQDSDFHAGMDFTGKALVSIATLLATRERKS